MDPARRDADRAAVASFYGSRPLLYDGTGRSVAVSAWLYDMEMIFYTCHVEDRLQVSLASRCLIADARLWWMTHGERQMPGRSWAHFRTVVLARYGPIPAAGPDEEQYRDPEIYRDMHHRRYQSLMADWHAYPQESMGHYCRRFQEAMLPYIPQDLPHPQLQALVILRNGVPPHIRRFVMEPSLGRTVGDMMDDILQAEVMAPMAEADAYVGEYQVPVDDAGIGEPLHEMGPMFPEDPIPAMPVQEIPAQQAEDQMEAEDSDDDVVVIHVDPPEDPPVIVISSDEEDDEDEEDAMEPEDEQGVLVEDVDDFDDDPEEIPLRDEDWEEDSDADPDLSVITIQVVV